jgi:hypothetical protein
MTPVELELWRRLLNMDAHLEELAARRARQQMARERDLLAAARTRGEDWQRLYEQRAAEHTQWVQGLQERYRGPHLNEALSRAATASAWRRKTKPPEETHRERRSRIEWSDMLDDGTLVISQVAWERGETVVAMREAGLTLRAIGRRFGLSGARIKQIADKAYRMRQFDRRPPIDTSAERVAASVAIELKSRPRVRRFVQALDALGGGHRRDWLDVRSA